MSEVKKPSAWVWISLSLIIALFVSFILFLDNKIVKNHEQIAAPENDKSEQIKPVFDFYTVLPERKVDIPKKSVPTVNSSNGTVAKMNKKEYYILQAGSFQKLVDADRHKAELALLGLEASINTVNVDGKTFHRIELGPFDGGSIYSRVQKQLIENNISYLTRMAN